MLIVASVCKWHMFVECYTPHRHVIKVAHCYDMAHFAPASSLSLHARGYHSTHHTYVYSSWRIFIRCQISHLHVVMIRTVRGYQITHIAPAGSHHGTWFSHDTSHLHVVAIVRGYQMTHDTCKARGYHMTHITAAGSHHGTWLSDDTHHTCR
jgi:hypothetical protein